MHSAILEDTARSLNGNASYSKSNLSPRGDLDLKKHKCGWHAYHRSAEIIHSYCKSHHCAFHIWKEKHIMLVKQGAPSLLTSAGLEGWIPSYKDPHLKTHAQRSKTHFRGLNSTGNCLIFRILKKYKYRVICYCLKSDGQLWIKYYDSVNRPKKQWISWFSRLDLFIYFKQYNWIVKQNVFFSLQ